MTESAISRKLAAIMFTDIVGYSKMMGEDEAGTLAFLHIHNDIVRQEIENNDGREIQRIGDAFLVEFSSAVNATRCALAIQKRLHEYNRNQPLKRYVRIGIHVGDIVVSGNDIFGDGVNVAARLQPLAEPGGICISREVYHHLKGKVEIEVTKLGLRELKNITQRIEIYQIVMEALTGAPKSFWKRVPLKVLGIISGCLLLLGLGYFWGYPQYAKWQEGKQWYLYLSEDITSEYQPEMIKLKENWNIPGGVFEDYHPVIKELSFTDTTSVFSSFIYTKKEIPDQPFRVRIISRVTSDNDGYLLLTAPHKLEIKKDPRATTQSPLAPHPSWNGITVFQEYTPKRKRMKLSLGHISKDGTRSDGLLENLLFPIGTREYTTEVTYDNDLIQYEGQGTKAQELARNLDLDKAGKICFGIGGYNIGVSKIEIYLKKENRDLDMITAADSYRMKGNYDLALKLYDDLIQRVLDNDSKCRFLYRKAMVYLDLKKPDEAIRMYKEIVENYPDNPYTGYARFDLGYLFYKLAGEKGRPQAARESDRYFRELIQKQSGHSEVPKAKYYLLLNLVENLRDQSQAEEGARVIIEDKANYYRNDALEVLYGKIYDVYGHPSRATLEKALGYLDSLIMKNPKTDPLGDELVITKLKVLRSQKRWDEFFDLIFSTIHEAEFSTGLAHFVYPLLIECKKDPSLGPGLDKFYGRIDENKKEAMQIYRNMISIVGEHPDYHAYGFLIRNLSYRKADLGMKVDPVRRIYDPKGVKVIPVFTSGPSQEGSVEGDDTVVLDYDTGDYWGCGFGLEPNVGPLIKDGDVSLVDLRGYDSFEFEAFAPKGLLFEFSLAESGEGPMTNDKFPGINGSDGELYLFPGFVGAGRWKKYHADLADLKPDIFYGNQKGNNILDLQAICTVNFRLSGSQGRGQFKVRNVVFMTK